MEAIFFHNMYWKKNFDRSCLFGTNIVVALQNNTQLPLTLFPSLYFAKT